MPALLCVDLNGLPTIFVWEFMAVRPRAEPMRQMKGCVERETGWVDLLGWIGGWLADWQLATGYLDLVSFVVRRVVIKFKICTHEFGFKAGEAGVAGLFRRSWE